MVYLSICHHHFSAMFDDRIKPSLEILIPSDHVLHRICLKKKVHLDSLYTSNQTGMNTRVCHCCRALDRVSRQRLAHSRPFSNSNVDKNTEPTKLPSRNWGELKRAPPPHLVRPTGFGTRDDRNDPGPSNRFRPPGPNRQGGRPSFDAGHPSGSVASGFGLSRNRPDNPPSPFNRGPPGSSQSRPPRPDAQRPRNGFGFGAQGNLPAPRDWSRSTPGPRKNLGPPPASSGFGTKKLPAVAPNQPKHSAAGQDEIEGFDDADAEGVDGGAAERRQRQRKASMSFRDRMAAADSDEEFEITRGSSFRSEKVTAGPTPAEKAERKRKKLEAERMKQFKAERRVFIPSTVTVADG